MGRGIKVYSEQKNRCLHEVTRRASMSPCLETCKFYPRKPNKWRVDKRGRFGGFKCDEEYRLKCNFEAFMINVVNKQNSILEQQIVGICCSKSQSLVGQLEMAESRIEKPGERMLANSL